MLHCCTCGDIAIQQGRSTTRCVLQPQPELASTTKLLPSSKITQLRKLWLIFVHTNTEMARPKWMSSIEWEIESLHTASTASTFDRYDVDFSNFGPEALWRQNWVEQWREGVYAASPSLAREVARQARGVTGNGKSTIELISGNLLSDLQP